MLRPLDLSNLQTIFPAEPSAAVAKTADAARLVTKVEKRRFTTIANSRKAAQQIGTLPKPGECLHLLLAANAFACFDIVPALLELVGRPATAVRLATLGINDRHVEALDKLAAEKQIRDCRMVVSHYFSKADPDEFAHAAEVFRRHGWKLAAARSHAKVIAVRFNSTCYVAESSGNLRSCRASEQMTIHCDRRLYEWHARWIGELTEANQ